MKLWLLINIKIILRVLVFIVNSKFYKSVNVCYTLIILKVYQNVVNHTIA